MPNETQKPERIEKPWAVYGLITKYIGRVKKEESYASLIEYIEGQLFSWQWWRNNSIQRFETPKKAIEYIASKYPGEHSKGLIRKQLTETVLDDFPKAIKQESLQGIHDILSSYAQRQPKCTEQTPFRRIDAMEPGYSELND